VGVIKSEGSPKEVPGRPQLQALQDTSESLSPGSLQSALQDVISVLAVYESSNLEPNQWARLVRRLPEILSHLERSLVEFLEKNTSECNSLKVRLAELRKRGKKRESDFRIIAVSKSLISGKHRVGSFKSYLIGMQTIRSNR
jgi:hypothetical protein